MIRVYLLYATFALIVSVCVFYSLIQFDIRFLIPWVTTGIFFGLWRAERNPSSESFKSKSKKTKVKRLW